MIRVVTTNICVETTARDASRRDYRAFFVSDTSGELDQQRHEVALATLGFGFRRVVYTDDVAFTDKPIELA